MCFPLVVAAQALGNVSYYLSGFCLTSLCFNNGFLAKFWSVKYINPTCWLKLMSILRKGFCCCLFNVSLPLCVLPCIFDKFHASFFWFCTIFSKEDSWFFYFYCVLFHVCGLCVRISVERIVKCLFVLWLQVWIQRGGHGVWTPWKITSYMGFNRN